MSEVENNRGLMHYKAISAVRRDNPRLAVTSPHDIMQILLIYESLPSIDIE